MAPFATLPEHLVTSPLVKNSPRLMEAFQINVDPEFNNVECPNCDQKLLPPSDQHTSHRCGVCHSSFQARMPFSDMTIEKLALRAMEMATLKETNDKGQIVYDFDDQIYLPVRCRWARPKYDLVIIDEAQDMNYTQLLLAQKIARGRIVVVGDDRQAIYGFRGADSDALDRLKNELRAKELGLTVTFRCPKSVVEMAQQLVPDYLAAETAKNGTIVRDVPVQAIYENADGGDFVLSRVNAPLAKICLGLLRRGKRSFIRGRKVGEDIKKIALDLQAKSLAGTIPELIEAARNWIVSQMEILKAKAGPDGEVDEKIAENITDQAETIIALSQDLTTIPELIARIDALFSEDKIGPNSICCSSIHRAKGLEASRVFLLSDTLRSGSVEEDNIAYVGMTRTKDTLFMVNSR